MYSKDVIIAFIEKMLSFKFILKAATRCLDPNDILKIHYSLNFAYNLCHFSFGQILLIK